MTTAIKPTEIRCSSDKQRLTIGFSNGVAAELSAELLRVESPSAEVQGHGAGAKVTPLDKQDVKITAIHPVGNYAIRISFDDGHDTGIYSWALLADYAEHQQEMMADYHQRAAKMR